MSKFRMVCVDLDGTLFGASGEVSVRNADALRSCLERGVRVYLVTGRPYCFTRYYARRISGEAGCICANGACVEDGEYFRTHEISKAALESFIDALEESGSKAFFKSLSRFYTHEEYDERFLYQHRTELFTDRIRLETYTCLSYPELKLRADNIQKVLAYDEDKRAMAALRERTEHMDGLNVSSYNDMSIDVTARGVDKGSGIREVCLRNGIKREEILAIGDSYNDLPMFEASGFSVAMGNAVRELKERADTVTGQNTENGVAQALERYILTDEELPHV